MECSGSTVLEKLARIMASRHWSKWLEDTMKAFTAGLAGVSEQRVADVVIALFLAEYASSVYAAERLTGKSVEEAFESALNALCAVYDAARKLVEESFKRGELEKHYREAVKNLGGGEEAKPT